MAKKSLIPKSKAKTAYGLLTEVKRLILAEPKRYYQRWWGYRDKEDIRAADLDVPRCGTVCCVGGWVATLKRGIKTNFFDADEHAQDILGLSDEQALALFDECAIPWRLKPQTKAYARAGAKHIERFQRKHAAQLKATRV